MSGVAVAGPPVEDAYQEQADGFQGVAGEDLDVETLGRRAKPDERFWQVRAGARFGEKESRGGTPFELDFFDVRFRDESSGFAVGAECREQVPPDDPDFEAKVNGCERVPVIWRFTPLEGWREVYRGSLPGYVGSVAFIDERRAIAVGGTGKYPRREPNGVGPNSTWEERVRADREEGAGMARAWLWEAGNWRELTDLPAGMRGLNAVDFWVGSGQEGREDFGAAGGLGQIWLWRGDGFKERFDRDVAAPYARDAHLFDARVRQIQIAPDPDHPHVFAATAGCCGTQAADGTPDAPAARLIEYLDVWENNVNDEGTQYVRYGEKKPPDQPRWKVTSDPTPVVPGPRAGWDLLRPRLSDVGGDSIYAFDIQGAQAEAEAHTGRFGGFKWTFSTERQRATGGAATETETAFRFVDAGGDTEPFSGGNGGWPSPPPGNGNLDWALGEYRAADKGLGGQALVETTHEVRPSVGNVDIGDPVKGKAPAPAEEQVERNRQSLASRAWTLPTYRLNALEMIDQAGDGWAVGDHGAIVRYAAPSQGTAGGADQDIPPRLGNRSPDALPDRSPYDQTKRSGGAAGVVPALAAQPREAVERPAFEPYGSSDASERRGMLPEEDVGKIVMSRDGDRGWALGSGPDEVRGNNVGLTLYRFDGDAWTRCDPFTIPGVAEADRECAGIAGLARLQEVGGVGNRFARITAAVRVPLENDDDPFNDDEFEVLAVGTLHQAPDDPGPVPLVVRYTEKTGWQLESWEMRSSLSNSTDGSKFAKDLVLTAPDQGWLMREDQTVFRFDGRRFIDCDTLNDTKTQLLNRDACGDPDNLLPARNSFNPGWGALTQAGDRVYLGGSRTAAPGAEGAWLDLSQVVRGSPVILRWDAGKERWEREFDPGPGVEPGLVTALSITEREDGDYEGFAFGSFGGTSLHTDGAVDTARQGVLRLGRDGQWRPYGGEDAAVDYLSPLNLDKFTDLGEGFWMGRAWPDQTRQVSIPGEGEGPARTFVSRRGLPGIVEFDPGSEGFRLLETDALRLAYGNGINRVLAMAPDGQGGFWAAVTAGGPFEYAEGKMEVFFHRYTKRPRRAVFEEMSHPAGPRPITALAGAANGSVWVGTDSDALYRYDRVTGFDRVRVPGWDPGKIVTSATPVNAIAVDPTGEGVAVGDDGRIANIGPRGAQLDRAAGAEPCEAGAAGPCGTGRDLHAAAVAPDGSAAVVGGDKLLLLWRDRGGEFVTMPRPQIPRDARVTGLSMPTGDSVWAVTNQGQVVAARRSGGSWSWSREALDARGKPVGRARERNSTINEPMPGDALALRGVAVRPDGTGYAVGDEGLILERKADGAWVRVATRRTDDLFSVTLPAGGGPGVLVGGRNGLILTLQEGRFRAAREADFARKQPGPVTGLALVPGTGDGEVEAWASVESRERDNRTGIANLLHYSSDRDDPLMRPDRRVEPLPDAPAARERELTFAAFGRSDCFTFRDLPCGELWGGPDLEDSVIRRVRDEIAARGRRTPGGLFALHTGDASDSGGVAGRGATRQVPGADGPTMFGRGDTGRPGWVKFRRLDEFVFSRLEQEGVGVLGAIGGRDLAESPRVCAHGISPICVPSSREGGVAAGENLVWRQVFAGRRGGWGSLDPLEAGGLRFVPVERNRLGYVSDQPGVKIGAARTHYASDVERGDGTKVARVVVVDSSLRSVSASNAIQQPAEEQQAWLERVLCFEGQVAASGERCTREPGQPAIVVTNTPSYSYGPGAGSDTLTDQATFEALLMRHKASVVVSGRIGWNGRYWATAPGLHEPCPGGAYQDTPPRAGARCGRDVGAVQPPAAAKPLAEALRGAGVPTSPEEADERVAAETGKLGASGLLPFVVSSTAGGQFGPDGQATGEARNGYWRGYSIVRVPADGDPAGVIVEQRPIFDWVRIQAQEHVMYPGQRMTLRGEGREPFGTVGLGIGANARFNRIDSPAITHRYDLLEADPDNPHLPRKDADGNHVPLDPSVATVDRQTGLVRTGRGNQARTYAIGLLSVGEKAATWPLVFEPRKSFRPPPPARVAATPIPRATPPIRTLAQSPQVPPQPPAQAPPPVSANPQLPPTPALPAPPPPFSGTTAQPPAPPAPPPPPPPQLPTALDLLASPPSVPLAPQATVIPPPAPPIQPAPPGGARREARQRQAAVQKGEEGGKESSETEGLGGDTAEAPHGPGHAATRLEPARAEEGSFTARARDDQPSAWARGALYGGGIGLGALVLSLAWVTVRPRPTVRRREPELPAPAQCNARRR